MKPRWRIELLGQLRLCRGETDAIPLQPQKATLLLAYLACHPRHPHPREALASCFGRRPTPRKAATASATSCTSSAGSWGVRLRPY